MATEKKKKTASPQAMGRMKTARAEQSTTRKSIIDALTVNEYMSGGGEGEGIPPATYGNNPKKSKKLPALVQRQNSTFARYKDPKDMPAVARGRKGATGAAALKAIVKQKKGKK